MTKKVKNQKKNKTKKIKNRYFKRYRSKLNKKKSKRKKIRGGSIFSSPPKQIEGFNEEEIKSKLIRLIKIIDNYPDSLKYDILNIFRHLLLIESNKNKITFVVKKIEI
jgi:hypothetical protein